MVNEKFYEILGIATTATLDEIKKAYRLRAKECHPDLHPDDFGAKERFCAVSRAYETLKSSELRALYDHKIQRDANQANRSARPKTQSPSQPFSKRADCRRPAPSARPRKKHSRADKKVFKINLNEAFTGTKQPIELRCKGHGQFFMQTKTVIRLPPSFFNKTLYVSFSNGFKSSIKIVLKAKKGWKVRGFDVWNQRKIMSKRLLNGTNFTITGIDNRKLRVYVPPHTISGTVIRLHGQGFVKPDGQRGELYIRII